MKIERIIILYRNISLLFCVFYLFFRWVKYYGSAELKIFTINYLPVQYLGLGKSIFTYLPILCMEWLLDLPLSVNANNFSYSLFYWYYFLKLRTINL